MLTRRHFVQGLGAAALGAPQLAAAGERPNIVFIMADDMGVYDLGCYGSKAIKTPSLDRLASEGMRFLQAYAGCTVCAPSRSTLMTGTHAGHTPVRGNAGGIPLREHDVTLAEVLKKAGYAVGGFGKWGLGDLGTSGVPEKHGFDRFFGYYHQIHAQFYYTDELIDTGRKVVLEGNRGYYTADPKPGVVAAADPKTGKPREFSAYRIFEETKQFIRDNKDHPFFCYAPWTPPHGYDEMPATEAAWKLYKDKPWSLPARMHAAFCSMLDRQVGEMMALLKELNLEERTIVFFCSDNGADERYEGELDSCGPLAGNKGSMYEGGIRTPFVVRWPGKVEEGSASDLPIYFPDVMPTIAAFTGAAANLPKGIDGISIGPELLGEKHLDRERRMYWEWPSYDFSAHRQTGLMQACRDGQWKIVRNSAEQPWELYDISEDEGETNDLARQLPDIVQELAGWVSANRKEPPPQLEPAKPEGRGWR